MKLQGHKLGSDTIRRNWRDVLDEVVAGESVMVMRAGKPVAVIIPIGHWHAVKDTLENIDDSIDLKWTIEYYRRGVQDGTIEPDAVFDRAIAHMEGQDTPE